MVKRFKLMLVTVLLSSVFACGSAYANFDTMTIFSLTCNGVQNGNSIVAKYKVVYDDEVRRMHLEVGTNGDVSVGAEITYCEKIALDGQNTNEAGIETDWLVRVNPVKPISEEQEKDVNGVVDTYISINFSAKDSVNGRILAEESGQKETKYLVGIGDFLSQFVGSANLKLRRQ